LLLLLLLLLLLMLNLSKFIAAWFGTLDYFGMRGKGSDTIVVMVLMLGIVCWWRI